MSDFSFTGTTPSNGKFYDKMVYDTLHFKRKKGAKHEVGIEIEKITPDADEIRLLGNRHRDCKYY